jgi:hypothetical protein
MAATESRDGDTSRPTLAGCLLMVLSLAVIFGLAVPLVRWRHPETGQPLPRSVAIFVPVLAGALCYGIGSVILRLLGLPLSLQSQKDPPDEQGGGDHGALQE